ncbi:hypothetical protein NDU88_007015 [Pleurodeles waltl]|uniref:Uncharacterized protein n=1 Tax=Pleurodeles waltl TaxID=8319 RepID=A0AAV7RP39_PLEWA|nr:hypothetical protein NDU88_007015 [Pleurodeles waltl]
MPPAPILKRPGALPGTLQLRSPRSHPLQINFRAFGESKPCPRQDSAPASRPADPSHWVRTCSAATRAASGPGPAWTASVLQSPAPAAGHGPQAQELANPAQPHFRARTGLSDPSADPHRSHTAVQASVVPGAGMI